MFENVDGRRTDDGRTDARVTGILIAHLRAFGSGELIKAKSVAHKTISRMIMVNCLKILKVLQLFLNPLPHRDAF